MISFGTPCIINGWRDEYTGYSKLGNKQLKKVNGGKG